MNTEQIAQTLARHTRVALQFSGGKDSIATLEVLRPFWSRLAVYWVNTGDAYPEVLDVVEKARALVPHFVELHGDKRGVIARYGMPSDLVPFSSAEESHRMGVGHTPPMQDRFSCCRRTIMEPMRDRMAADDITLIIRGQRAAETFKSALRSGDVVNGVEMLFPLEDWPDEDVLRFIVQRGWDIPRYYLEGMPHSGDCMTCTAWVGDGRAAYLKRHHPEKAKEYADGLRMLVALCGPVISNTAREYETLFKEN
jgi:phosphoadenosine phosphosulfate reductase